MKTILKYFVLLNIFFISYNTVFSNPINLYISSVSPSMNAVSVNKSFNITIIFTQDMNSLTINGTNIKVFGFMTGLLPVTIDYNPISKTANINPNQDFKNGEVISVTLTSGLKTAANESISSFVYTFRSKAIGGNGIFTKSSGINTPGEYIRSGDIDGDGDIDLLLNDIVYKNDGNAFFIYYSSLSISGYPILADFDNDGDLDIQSSTNYTSYFLQNNGNGNFIQTISYPGSNGSIGDLNGDGYFDMAYISQQNVNDLIIVKNSHGVMSIDTIYQVNTNCSIGQYHYSDRIMVDDLNNDGALDLVGINGFGDGNSITFYYLCRSFHKLTNDGSGRFTSLLFYSETTSSAPPFILFISDSKTFDNNNDGFIDIQTSGLILKNNGNGSFVTNGNFGAFWNSLESDFTGDGYIDFFINIPSSPLIEYINNADGSYTQYIHNNFSYDPSSAYGDFDNDGDIDIAIKEYNRNEVAILLNGDIPLPVELNSFTFEVKANTVKLNWSTSNEQNNSGFEIQRSFVKNESPEEWVNAGYVEAAGNSNTSSNYSFEDKNLTSGKYKFRLKQFDFNGYFEYLNLSNEVLIGIPSKSGLAQNYPNPFNPVTKLGFGISNSGFVSLKVYDVLGNEIKTLVNKIKPAGYYEIEFNGSGLPSGIYYYKLEADSFSQVRKMMLVK